MARKIIRRLLQFEFPIKQILKQITMQEVNEGVLLGQNLWGEEKDVGLCKSRVYVVIQFQWKFQTIPVEH